VTFAQLMKRFGTQAEIARQFTPPLAASTVCMWQTRGIPRGRQVELELLTKGALKADRPAKKGVKK
jgi:hypothetical protein